MTAREENTLAKRIFKEIAGFSAKSLKRGSGTAYGWIYIKVDKPITEEQKDAVRARLVEERICGTYWPDDGYSDAGRAQVLFTGIGGYVV